MRTCAPDTKPSKPYDAGNVALSRENEPNETVFEAEALVAQAGILTTEALSSAAEQNEESSFYRQCGSDGDGWRTSIRSGSR